MHLQVKEDAPQLTGRPAPNPSATFFQATTATTSHAEALSNNPFLQFAREMFDSADQDGSYEAT